MARKWMASMVLAGICQAAVPSESSPLPLAGCDLTIHGVKLSPNAQIFLPNNASWATETERWTQFKAPTYTAAIRPHTEADVQAIVKFATACGIPFLASSGQHGFSGTLASMKSGIEIDMSNFRDVTVDAATNLMTVGGGVRFMDVFDPVYNAGKEISTGSGACVGMISPSISGGVGRLSGTHGTLSDQLHSLRVITGNGTLITVSEDENPDLWWAMRGAGNNFGIVTQAVYKVMDLASPKVVVMDYAYRANDTAAIIDYLASFGTDTPAELSFILEAVYNEALFGGFGIDVSVVYNGPRDEAEALLAPLLKAAKPFLTNVTEVGLNEMVYKANFGGQGSPATACNGNGGNHSVFGGAIYSYDTPTWVAYMADLEKLLTENEDLRGTIFFLEQFSNVAIAAADASQSSFPWRNITAHLLPNYAWTLPESEHIANDFGAKWRSTIQDTSGYDKPQLYTNYAHGDESPEELYGAENLPRLRALKKKWDPTNQFGFYNPVS